MDVEPQTKTAPHPFDDPKADVVFKTSDGVEVRTYNFLLSLASPLFESMFSLPQPVEDTQKGAIDVPEDSESFMKLLRWCDHRVSPSMDLENLLDALVLADKYDMACIISRVEIALTSILEDQADAEDTLSIFAIAYKLRLEDLMKFAARCTLLTPELDEFPHVKELELIPATAMHQLSKYHSSCRKYLPDSLEDVWSDSESPVARFRRANKSCTACNDSDKVPKWLDRYINTLKAYFERRIAASAAYAVAVEQKIGKEAEIKMAKCSKCKSKIQKFRKMQKDLAEWIDDQVYEVGTEIAFFRVKWLISY